MIHIIIRTDCISPSKEGKEMLLSFLGKPMEDTQFEYAENGKPYLKEGPFFNITHSGSTVSVAISDSPVGIDLECIRSSTPKVARKVMSDIEYAWFESNDFDDKCFYTLWTLKESYYKYLGTGLPLYPNNTEFVFQSEWTLKGSTASFITYRTEEFILSICSGAHSDFTIHLQ